ncbi:MAG: hypothetical protein A2498_08185 [Lentisphaerae bacterium RIFOXYC12_FULL_60_16]|nr:MAG: hypothetical protein A2498_08185 [Lentisphaerae bacterium RIFOXYC12_FULL_60_16]OGV79736.1 MAG: hypothetical protein A2340_14755 [Lentisphaerae bacterium RIFOXYB12_FULL_60_10]
MEQTLSIPSVGENVKTIQVIKCMAGIGDTVQKDQPVLELETDKAVLEVPAAAAGTVRQFLVKAGDEVSVGAPFLVLTVPDNATAPAAPAAPAKQEPVPAAPEPAKPQAETGQPKVPAPAPTPPSPTPPPPPPETTLPRPERHVPAAPSVRRFARELGVDVDQVPGTGPHNRVSRDDVMQFVRTRSAARSGAGTPPLPPLPDFTQWGPVTIEKMSVIRRRTAEHLSRCWSTIPHVTIHDKADITGLEALRIRYAPRAEKQGGKLTMAVMVTKIVAAALKSFARFRSSVDMDNQSLIVRESIHVGIAVATARGLVVPVIRDADRKNMIELAVEISAIAERARTGKLALEEMQGGVFTVTNLGRYGGTFFTPIINHPEVAILGIGRYNVEAAGEPGQGPRTLLPLSLSFDHRVIDGADGAAFLGWIIDAIQQPLLLALEG